MKTDGTNKVIIKIASQDQEENAKNSRKTLKVLQESAVDKENLVGRSKVGKDSKLVGNSSSEAKKKKIVNVVHKAVQTGEATITAEDLTSDEPGIDYWKALAEQREISLTESLEEIGRLRDINEALEEENKTCKEMLDEAKHLIEVLQEMMEEHDTTRESIEEGSES